MPRSQRSPRLAAESGREHDTPPAVGASDFGTETVVSWPPYSDEETFPSTRTGEELSTPDGIGRYNHFENGSIYWSPATGAFEIHGPIRTKWEELGWERSFLGYPLSGVLPTVDGAGRYARFQHGLISWTPQGGAKAVPKPILNVSLVKEHSRPEVYFVCGGAKLWIHSPAEFNAVGFDWAKATDVLEQPWQVLGLVEGGDDEADHETGAGAGAAGMPSSSIGRLPATDSRMARAPTSARAPS